MRLPRCPPRVVPPIFVVVATLFAAVVVHAEPNKACYPPAVEILALKDLYYSLGGSSWRHQDNWLTGNPCGDAPSDSNNWIGVVCGPCRNNVRHVEVISLEWNNLEGNLTDTLSLLKQLQVLNVGTNNIRGELPPSIGELTDLRVLKLSYNKIEGKWPPEVLNLHKLEVVELPYNDFVGNVNDMFEAYPNMKRFNVRGNRGFGGELKQAEPFLRKMRGLLVMDLHWNNIGGKMPAALFDLPDLEELVLSSNDISGQLPRRMNLPRVKLLHINDNYLEGTIPYAIGNLTSLTEFVFDENMISGSLPSTIGNLRNLEVLRGRWNLLRGALPESLYSLHNLKTLDLGANALGGTLSPRVGELVQLGELKLHSCMLSGTIPEHIGRLVNLQHLDLFNNLLSGTIPQEIGLLRHLGHLNLRTNLLSGAVPAEIGWLRQLNVLQLHDNRLESLPETIGDLPQLRKLMLHKNRFAGTIPDVIGHLYDLTKLSLHGNRFTGTVPASFGNLMLDDLTVHDNQLDGDPYLRVDPGIDERRPYNHNARRPYCENLRNTTTGELTHMYFRTCGTRNDFYVDVLVREKRVKWKETHGDNWMSSYGKCKPTRIYADHYEFQKTSRFAEMREVADKHKFATYVRRQRLAQGNAFDFHPLTFRMPFDLARWTQEYERHPEGYWLLKPSISCCGQNIRLVSGPHDPTFPTDLGNWIIQRFVHPPYIVNGHKFVLRLFAILTSFSPMRLYLHPDGDVFYTHAEYSLDPEKIRKRGYFISDYFFTKKQREMYTTSTHLMDYLKSTGVDTDKVFRDLRDVLVKALMVSEPQYRMQEQDTISFPGSVYEVFGYDILLDADLKPHVCEVNTTPNMGLEINRGNDPVVHEEDFDVKTRIMQAVLEITGIVPLQPDAPNFVKSSQSACSGIVHDKLRALRIGVNESAVCPDDDLTFRCLTQRDIDILVAFECEMQRRGPFEPMFPAESADELVKHFPIFRRENYLQLWWQKQRPADPKPQYSTAWSVPTPRPFRENPNYNWDKHKWTPNMPGNRWNTEEDGVYPEEEPERRSYLNDGDAFDDPEPAVQGDMSDILNIHAAHASPPDVDLSGVPTMTNYAGYDFSASGGIDPSNMMANFDNTLFASSSVGGAYGFAGGSSFGGSNQALTDDDLPEWMLDDGSGDGTNFAAQEEYEVPPRGVPRPTAPPTPPPVADNAEWMVFTESDFDEKAWQSDGPSYVEQAAKTGKAKPAAKART